MYIQLEAKRICAKDDDQLTSETFGTDLFGFLRLCAEGQNREMQRILQFQENNRKEVNLLFETVEFLVLVVEVRRVHLLFSLVCFGTTAFLVVRVVPLRATGVLRAPGAAAPGAAWYGRGQAHRYQ